jgi:hypothetical protein
LYTNNITKLFLTGASLLFLMTGSVGTEADQAGLDNMLNSAPDAA